MMNEVYDDLEARREMEDRYMRIDETARAWFLKYSKLSYCYDLEAVKEATRDAYFIAEFLEETRTKFFGLYPEEE